jgi:hypothetical protein
MKKLKHYILLAILIMAIPLQGFAAASMMLCATEHHQVSVTQISQVGEHMHDVYSEHHEHQAQGHDVDAQSSDTTTTQQHGTKDKCSACASCCVGAAMLTSYLDAPVSRPASEKIDMVFSSHVGYISDGLERPPRA